MSASQVVAVQGIGCLPAALAVDGHCPEAIYPYSDLNGLTVGAVARFGPGTLLPGKKSFRQFRFEGGQYVLGLNGIELPLYRSAELLTRFRTYEGFVFVVEGEKCVDRLWSEDLPATTNPGGAGNWSDSYARVLAGRDVVVIPDHDAPGRAHAMIVAASCLPTAKSVRVLTTPGVQPGDPDDGRDVFDWLENGGSAQELAALAAAAPPLTPSDLVRHGWEEPTPFAASSEPEPFPVDTALPPALARAALEFARVINVDVMAPAVMMPVAIVAAAGNEISVKVKADYSEPCLSRYALWSKPSGERGSQTFRLVFKPIEEWMDEDTKRFRAELTRTSKDREFYAKRAARAEKQAAEAESEAEVATLRQTAEDARKAVPVVRPRLFVSVGDTTAEALVRTIDSNGGGGSVICADARHIIDEILGQRRGEGVTNDSAYLQAHGGDSLDRNRVGQGTENEQMRVSRPSLGMALGVQPDKVAEFITRPELVDSGMIGRCNIIAPTPRAGTRIETGEEAPLDTEVVSEWNRAVVRLIEWRRQRIFGSDGAAPVAVELELDEFARRLRRDFANEIERRLAPDEDLEHARSIGSKAAGEAARLAGIFHLAEAALENTLDTVASRKISAATWRRAETHQRWQLNETLRVLSLSKEPQIEQAAKRTLAWARRKRKVGDRVLVRELISARLVEDTAEAAEVLKFLEERGWVRRGEPKVRGDAGYVFHPLTFSPAERTQAKSAGNDSAHQQLDVGGAS